jgi:hypothetical protein
MKCQLQTEIKIGPSHRLEPEADKFSCKLKLKMVQVADLNQRGNPCFYLQPSQIIILKGFWRQIL